MKIKLGTAIVMLFAASQIVACSKSAPKCGDPETKNLVLQILKENTYQDSDISTKKISIENIRTVGTDKDTGKNSCAGEADVTVTLTGGSTPTNQFKKNISFTSEITSEKKHYVSVSLD